MHSQVIGLLGRRGKGGQGSPCEARQEAWVSIYSLQRMGTEETGLGDKRLEGQTKGCPR